MNNTNKKIHYGIEFGDFTNEGINTKDFVCISCRKFSNSLIKDFNYTMNKNKINCKRCLKILNRFENE